MTLHANTFVTKAPSPHIEHPAGIQKLPTDHKSGSLHVQSRKDTMEQISGEPDYVHPDLKGPISQADINNG